MIRELIREESSNYVICHEKFIISFQLCEGN